MKRTVMALCWGMSALGGTALAQTRSEIPLRQVMLPDGERRYGIQIKVGNTSIEAGLDSGSTGLRILPGTLADGDAKGGGPSDSYSYGAGTKFDGEVGTGTLGIGALSAPATMQLIQNVGCRRDIPRCPASRVPLAQFGIQGSGFPGQGFKAILGVNMADADVDNPFRAIGARRWIIELPRPEDSAPGRIILNPSDDEVKDFITMPILAAYAREKGGVHDAVTGCIINDTSKQKACGALLMDTGAPGILVNNGALGHDPWPDHTPATLSFYDSSKLVATETVLVGLRNHASHLLFGERPGAGVEILAGLAPYFAFSVLYDPQNGAVGIKPRPPLPNAPQGVLAEK